MSPVSGRYIWRFEDAESGDTIEVEFEGVGEEAVDGVRRVILRMRHTTVDNEERVRRNG